MKPSYTQTTIQSLRFAPDCRIIVISDLHCPAGWVTRLLRQISYHPGQDYLVILGDLIEKSPCSLDTLRTVMALAEAPRVIVLMGNNDIWRLAQISAKDESWDKILFETSLHNARRWGGSLFFDMCREMDLPLHTRSDTPRARIAAQSAFAPELAFLRSLPTILETPAYVFVHGGLPCHDSEIAALAGKESTPLLKFDNFLGTAAARDAHFSRWVIVGHWPVALYRTSICAHTPLIDHTRHIIAIDGGAGLKRDGQLNALLLFPDENRMEWAAVDDLPTVTARDHQAPSSDPLSINWGDNAVSIIEPDSPAHPGFCQIEHLRTGRRLLIPSDDFYQENGQLFCRESTDYRLPVEAGETLALVKRAAKGAIVKRSGIVGWYDGRLAEG